MSLEIDRLVKKYLDGGYGIDTFLNEMITSDAIKPVPETSPKVKNPKYKDDEDEKED